MKDGYYSRIDYTYGKMYWVAFSYKSSHAMAYGIVDTYFKCLVWSNVLFSNSLSLKQLQVLYNGDKSKKES